jgi:hypothetical protein
VADTLALYSWYMANLHGGRMGCLYITAFDQEHGEAWGDMHGHGEHWDAGSRAGHQAGYWAEGQVGGRAGGHAGYP